MSLLFEKRTILFNIVWSHILFISAAKLRLRCLNLYDMFNKWVISKQIFLIRTRILESNPKGFELLKTYLAVSLWTQCFGKNVWHQCIYVYTFLCMDTSWSKKSKLLMEREINIHFFRNTDGWQGWQPPPQKNRKLVSQVSPNKLAPIKGSAENGDRWHFYILFFLWLTARK